MGLLISEWEELLRDPSYWPLRVVEVAPNKCEVQNPIAPHLLYLHFMSVG